MTDPLGGREGERAGLPRYRVGHGSPREHWGARGADLSYGAGTGRYGGHRLGNYSSPQAGMLTVTATLPRVLGSGCPSIYPQWMGHDRHALSGMSATPHLTGDDRGGKPRHPTRFGRRAP
ncbi:hypothetical protein SEA_ELEPHANTOON_34 [Mycobacterium phage Elephantoon]|nr:hypothetical protein SEA_ELEPHANTOON_34 [Mycobacterium phage Elephantoon]